MSFLVKKTHHNGYRCCCARDWEDDGEWFDAREEALAQIPREIPKDDGDGGLKSVVVVDGSTGKEIASVSLDWSSGYGRGSGYQATLWSGWIEPGGDEAQIHLHEFKGPGETWSESIDIIREKDRVRREKEATQKLEAAQKELEHLKS